MDEEYERYFELYPVMRCLQEEITNHFIGTGKMIRVGKGNNVFVDSTFGEIIYDRNVEHVSIRYFLKSRKYKNLFREKLQEIYSQYYGVQVLDENTSDGLINHFANPCNLIVQIPCEDNKRTYLRTNASKRQHLKAEAYRNIQNGLVDFDNDSMDIIGKAL